MNVSLFGIFDAKGLKVWRRGHPHWHDVLTEFHKNLQIGSKLLKERHRPAERIVISFAFLSFLRTVGS
jgi:hypothetical protein